MKAADAKNPKFDGAWWKANKAKDADPGGKLEKVLDTYKKEKPVWLRDAANGVSGGNPSFMEKYLEDIKKAAVEELKNKKLGALQKETKEGLANYVKECDAALKAFKQIEGSPLTSSAAKTLIQGVDQFKTYCEKNFQKESFWFLRAMYAGKKTKETYLKYVVDKAPDEINAAGPTKKPMIIFADKLIAMKLPADKEDAAFKASKYWDPIANEIEKLIDRDVVKRFRVTITAELVKSKLP